jgi:acetyl esterase/lipase/lysophospholipase L1-like esterase
VLKISEDGNSTLTAYLPSIPSGRAVVCLPGGGYTHLAIDNEGHNWAEFFNKKGIAFFVLKYRMPKGDRNIPISDAVKSMKTVRDSSARWQINPYDVGIMGSSAGGHLASVVSTKADFYTRPNFSILFYPVISMDKSKSHVGSCDNFLGNNVNNKELIKEYSTDMQVRSHLTPETVIFLANDDGGVPPLTNGVAYYAAMRRNGNKCSLHMYPTGGHGFGFKKEFTYHEQLLNDLSMWLDNHKSPSKNAIRVACIGNSITDGFGIDMAEEKGYPAVLQDKLGDNYDVKNYGVSARTLMKKGDLPYVNEMAWRDAKAFNPNIVIVKLGTNDSKPENWQYNATYQKDLEAMVDTLKLLPAKPLIYLATPIPAFKGTWNINDSVIVNGIIPIIKKVARKKKCRIIDLHTDFAQYGGLMQADGIHPNAKGAARMADIIFSSLSFESQRKTAGGKQK